MYWKYPQNIYSKNQLFCQQENFIRKILAKPFKIPIANYISEGRHSLGVRRSGVRQPLHDPDDPDALVLYQPKELSAHEKMTTNM